MKTEPTEALELKKSIQYGLGIIDAGSGILSELSSMVDDVVNIAFSEGQSSPKIKQLEWDFYGLYYSAQTPFGTYTFEENEKNENLCNLRFGNLLLRKNIPVSEAKSAAQRDFEQKVKECLE